MTPAWIISKPTPALQAQFAALAPFSMLFRPEAETLYHYARDAYTGEGVIVDAGCFLGASTSCLALGLRENPRLPDDRKQGQIHSFDLFIVPDDEDVLRFFPDELAPGDSFFPVFQHHIRDFANLVSVHRGNIKKLQLPTVPVEYLFVDVAKCWETNQAIVDGFFPRLIPQRSFVQHQDYALQWSPWLHLTMEYFSSCFEICGHCGTSVFFRYLGGLEAWDRTPLRQLALPEKLELLTRAQRRFDPQSMPAWAIEAGRVLLVFLETSQAEALELVERLRHTGVMTPQRKDYLDSVEEAVRIWNWGSDLERDMTTKFERLDR